MKPIISVEGLGKSYVIRHEGQKTHYKSLREELFKLPKHLLQRNRQSQEEFWALKDVNFDVMPGDRVGIIGRNGAGKSTLLKLLSRITEPTTGRITLRGRVASLLEVGTGFHPELTGRENIFLNGAILGMSRAEVRRKFDEIVDFAGVEKFLDTPVKRYSSGMYVRLAFAVAAHLEPEILIVDEVLAVGDMEFQKKCLGKMEEVGKEGRTVLFVSHNMSAVQILCNSGIFLNGGSIEYIGDVVTSVNMYKKNDKKEKIYGKIVTEIKLFDATGRLNSSFSELPSKISIRCNKISLNFRNFFWVSINDDSRRVLFFDSRDYLENEDHKNITQIEINLPSCIILSSGIYRLNIAYFCNGILLDHAVDVTIFDIKNNFLKEKTGTDINIPAQIKVQ